MMIAGLSLFVAVARVRTLGPEELTLAGVAILFAGLGALIISQQPENRVGWLLLIIGGGLPVTVVADEAAASLGTSPEALTPGVFVIEMGMNVAWMLFIFPLLLLLYVFPTGRLLSRKWLWAPRLLIAMAAVAVTQSLFSTTIGPDDGSWEFANPIGFIESWIFDLVSIAWIAALLAVVIGGVVATVLRFRRASNVEKEQIKLVIVSTLFFGITFIALLLEDGWASESRLLDLLFPIAIGSIPVAITAAVLKRGLFSIDMVISKTVTYGILAVFITGVYAVVVVGIGSLVDAGSEPNLALSIVAVAIVAVAFEPLRNRLQGWANRIVFGERSTPYEVLSRATARLAGTDSPDEALGEVTQLVVDGTGAAEAVLWLRFGGTLQPSAATPVAALDGLAELLMSGDDLPELPGEASAQVRHRGEILGALSICKPVGESVTGVDEKMLHDIASGSGSLLRNISLNAELKARAEQLRWSRRRLVGAHDAERHRLERDLHDGAQQQVVAIKVKLGIARTLAEREGAPEVESIVSSLAVATQEAVDAMRAVAHGIYPPLLEAEGLGAALTAARRAFPISVDLEIDGVGRYERSVEQSLYFCSVETVTRAVDGGATRAVIGLQQSDDSVQFSVGHNGGVDDLVSVRDRVEALGGWLRVDERGVVTGQLRIADSPAVVA